MTGFESVEAICRDGNRSSATGKGACSHHGGENYWLYEYQRESIQNINFKYTWNLTIPPNTT